MSDVCSECGSEDVTIWLGGHEPRCENCPPEECARCGDEMNVSDEEPWDWKENCESCRDLLSMDVWCESCESQLVVSGWGYDGVEISCECSSCHVSHDSFSMRAPYSWKINGRHGERRMSKR